MKPLMRIGLDFETYWSVDYTLSKMTTAEYVRDPRFKAHGASVWIDGLGAVWLNAESLAIFCRDAPWSEIELFGHNLNFDGLILAEHYGAIPALYLDTLGMSRAVLGTSVRRHSLHVIGEHLGLGGKLDGGAALVNTKGRRDLSPVEMEALGRYAVRDIELTWRVLNHLLPLFPRQEIPLLDWCVRTTTQPCIRLDVPLLEQEFANEVARKEAALATVGVDRKALSSNPQLATLLETLGVSPPTKVSQRTGKLTYAFSKTDEDFVLLQEHPNPAVRALVDARLAVKTSIVETRCLKLAGIGRTGTLPAEINFAGAATTQRFSGSGGVNLQNLKRRSPMRRALLPPPGFKFVVADLSQIELRVAATLARQQDIIDELARGGCVYSQFASDLFNVPVSKKLAKTDTKIADYRQIGKVSVLQGIYGSGGATLKRALWVQTEGKISLDEAEARRTIYKFRSRYPRIPEFWGILEAQLYQWAGLTDNGITKLAERSADAAVKRLAAPFVPTLQMPFLKVTPDGRIIGPHGHALKYPDLQVETDPARRFPRINYRGFSREGNGRIDIYGAKAVENLCQWLARIVMSDAILEILPHYWIPLTVHDELVAVAPEGEAKEAEAFIASVMSRSPKWWPELKVECETGIGDTYGDAK